MDMKKIAVISFTAGGSELAEKISHALASEGYETVVAKKYKHADDSVKESLSEWTKEQFQMQDAIVFVGATGIAVRAIAPFIKTKVEDPAVLVIDEQGNYCIPILSGHLGGANELAKELSEKTGAIAVITTATDINEKWAVDVFAGKNNLAISDMKKAKEISAKILRGERIFVYIEDICCEIRGKIPDDVCLWTEDPREKPDIVIGVQKKKLWEDVLYLIPRAVVLGIGCRKGIKESSIEKQVCDVFRNADVFCESVCAAASIDLKKEEEGILAFCRKLNIKFVTYDAETLKNTEGVFCASAFVEQTTGVDNVCERSAVCASEGGSLLIRKQAKDGVTVAAAMKRWSVSFE